MNIRRLRGFIALSSIFAVTAAAGCVTEEPQGDEVNEEVGEASDTMLTNAQKRGKKLFRKETFDGNGRTCSSCHRGATGTISPETVQELYEENPDDPLFSSIDSDDGEGDSYTRLLEHATVRVILPLPPNLRPLDDLDAEYIVLNRSVPTTNDIALDPVLMLDGRAPDLATQALGAIHDHAENDREPTAVELADIAAFEETLFSSPQLRRYAEGGPEPTLPEGRTESEIRGKLWFDPDGFCGSCHGGPMLNTTTEFHPIRGEGDRFEAVLAGEFDVQPNPVRWWAILDDDGNVAEVIPFPFPDPGLALTTGNPADVTQFKIPTLWGVKKTAPYFHDNSAKTLEEMVSHYAITFEVFGFGTMTAQDEADILAYIKLL